MGWNAWMRQIHRWLSIIFTLIPIGIFIALGMGTKPVQWVYYLPLAPLALLVITVALAAMKADGQTDYYGQPGYYPTDWRYQPRYNYGPSPYRRSGGPWRAGSRVGPGDKYKECNDDKTASVCVICCGKHFDKDLDCLGLCNKKVD